MKKISFIAVILISFIVSASSQPCLPEGITFETQAQIDSFQINHPNCTEIEGDVTINGDDITNLNGLLVLTSIGGDLLIADYFPCNPNLISLSGLDNVTSIGEDLWIGYNDALTSLTGLDNVTSIGGVIEIWANNALTNLTGLDNVTSIGGFIGIDYNDALTSLTGLDNVTSIDGNLVIHENNALTSLMGLDNVTSIGGYLRINGNNALTSLTGLDNIESSTIEDLYIHDNSLLSTCEILSICNYLGSPNGNVTIESNFTGCNSPEEVLDSCEANAVMVEKKFIIEDFCVSPNPFTTSTTLSYTLDNPSSVTIRIFNPQGQLIEKIEQEQSKGEQQVQWNAEGLPAGMYYFRIQAGDKVGGGKMILIDE